MLGSLTLGGDGAGGFPARRGCPNLHHRTGRDEASRPSAKVSLLRKVSRQRMARFARRAWFEGPVQRKEPFPGKIFTPCVPERRFAGLFGCIARISCHSQLISDAWRANLAANWRFSRPRPLSGCMERKTCHGLPPGNAFREHFAIVERLGNAFREHFANGAASSCGRAYCLAIALTPHESDDLFVQAVLCT